MLFVLATNCMIDVGFVVARCAAAPLPSLPRSIRTLADPSRFFPFACSFVPLVLLWICGDNHLRLVWRLTFGLGIVPAALVLLWRLRMPSEPVRYRESAIKRNVPYGLVFRRYWKEFIGISLCWFLYEYVAFPRLAFLPLCALLPPVCSPRSVAYECCLRSFITYPFVSFDLQLIETQGFPRRSLEDREQCR